MDVNLILPGGLSTTVIVGSTFVNNSAPQESGCVRHRPALVRRADSRKGAMGVGQGRAVGTNAGVADSLRDLFKLSLTFSNCRYAAWID